LFSDKELYTAPGQRWQGAAVIAHLGKKVRRLREHADMTQAELAQALGLSEHSKGFISEIESGKKIPKAELVLRLAERFGVSTDYLLRDDLGTDLDNLA
jgi:transcriptional regulator with XRE-family HTH domain